MERVADNFTRIGVFYDGQFFSHVSNYYLYHHDRKARISISGLHEFIVDAVSEMEGVDKKHCRIVDAHYFRGRLSAEQAFERDLLYKERVWDDTLIRAGVTTHFLPLSQKRETGVDVWYALEAFELAMLKRFSVSVLIAGDGDYLPLLRKLHTIGTRTMVLAWDFTFVDESGESRQTRTNQTLLNEAAYVLEMHTEIDARSRKNDPIISGLFMPRKEPALEAPARLSNAERDKADFRDGTIVTLQDGYGFIKPDGGGDNLFFHHSYLLGTEFGDLSKGDKVTFVLGKNNKGPCALSIQRASVQRRMLRAEISDVEIAFRPSDRWNSQREVVEFSAELGGKPISCAISIEALCDHFGGDRKEPLSAFHDNRVDIESIAAKLIRQHRFEDDGSILIRSAD